MIWKLIFLFIYCGLFVLILVVLELFLLSQHFRQILPLAFFRWFTATSEGSNYWGYGYKTQHSYSQIKKPHLKMIPIKDKLAWDWKYTSSTKSSSSSSCRAASTDIPDPLSPLLPIVHRLSQVFRVTSRILS